MEKFVHSMQGIERINFFGVRHFSPAAAYHLEKLLNEVKPKCVLIEGPENANSMLPQIAKRNVQPPIAILSYTTELPVNTILYPFADYSPEYRAILWSVKNKADVRFIDLPTEISMEIHIEKENDKQSEYHFFNHELYSQVAKLNNEYDYDDYWERSFEHNLQPGSYMKTVALQSAEMRSFSEQKELEFAPDETAKNNTRESFMKRRIEDALTVYAPEKIVVITGAYHTQKIMSDECKSMTDDEIKKLPSRASNFTLMPYTSYRLSSRSGYGAGNKAPEYFQLMWEMMNQNQLAQLPEEYVVRLSRYVREKGGYCSTASVIETIRLANSLTSLKNGSQPTLRDLHDAANACIGNGDTSELVSAFAMLDVGTRIGNLPEGISQTPIQDDLNREIKRLKLDKYKTVTAQTLELDLRENIKVKSEEAAFIDLNRSIFLNRLSFLGINFAQETPARQDSATWKELWQLKWTPEVEIQAVESVLKGETIKIACAFYLKERLKDNTDLADTAALIAIAYKCDLVSCFELAVSALQSLAANSENFSKTAASAWELAIIIKYANLRKIKTEKLIPLLQQLFLRASFILNSCASCDDKAAAEIAESINIMHTISQECDVDDDAWVKELSRLAFRDDKNTKLSGLAFAILLERNIIDDASCQTEISKRLSPGIPADVGAGWFEGLSMRNHYALLSRIALWQELDLYISSLDDEEFKRSLVFLRRAFSGFNPREKNSIAELLGDIWGLDSQNTSIALQEELNEEEVQVLEELNDFDFDF